MAQQKITISTEFLATVKGMDDVVRQMQQGLAKADPSKTSGLSKMFTKMTDEYKNFQNLTKNGQVDLLDSKSVIRSGETILKLFREIQSKYSDFTSLDTAGLKKLFPEEFNKNIDEAAKLIDDFIEKNKKFKEVEQNLTTAKTKVEEYKKAVEDAKEALKSATGGYGSTDDLQKGLDGAKQKLIEASQSATDYTVKLRNALKETKAVGEFKNLKNMQTTIGNMVKAWQDYKVARDRALKATSGEDKKDLEARLANLQEALNKEQNKTANVDGTGGPNKNTLKQLDAEIKEVTNSLRIWAGVEEKLRMARATGATQEQTRQLQALSKEATNAAIAQNNASEEVKVIEATMKNAKPQIDALVNAQKNLTNEEAEIKELEAAYKDLGVTQDGLDTLLNSLKEMGVISKDSTATTVEDIERIKESLSKIDDTKAEELKKTLIELGMNTDDVEKLMDSLRQSIHGFGESANDVKRVNTELEDMKNRVKTFFGLANGVRIFQKAVRSSFDTIKELDKTMVETAVVTEFDVGDMWDQLPEYTRRAKELGVSINDTYKAATLYYQQGTEENLAFSKICSII